MARFFTSDTHFSHANIIRYSNRPFSDITHMNEAIIANWNAVVGEDDEVFHLGDVALGSWDTWASTLSRLNGRLTLVVGNHERIFRGERPKMQERFKDFYHEFFDEVAHNVEGFELVGGTVVNLSHFPYDGDSQGHDRYTEARIPDDGVPLVHGHTHAEFNSHGHEARVSRSTAGTPQVHVGMDAWDYSVVPESEILELLSTF